MKRGSAGSSSSFARSRRTWTVTVAGVVEEGLAPDRLHQLVARVDAARVLGEEGEQVELAHRQHQLLAVEEDASARGLDPQRPADDRRPVLGRPGGAVRRRTASTRATSSAGENGLTT